jgi:hypothetical protein
MVQKTVKVEQFNVHLRFADSLIHVLPYRKPDHCPEWWLVSCSCKDIQLLCLLFSALEVKGDLTRSISLYRLMIFRRVESTPRFQGKQNYARSQNCEKRLLTSSCLSVCHTLHKGQYTCSIISHSSLLTIKNVSDKSCRGSQNRHFIVNKIFFENRAVYEIMWHRCQHGACAFHAGYQRLQTHTLNM